MGDGRRGVGAWRLVPLDADTGALGPSGVDHEDIRVVEVLVGQGPCRVCGVHESDSSVLVAVEPAPVGDQGAREAGDGSEEDVGQVQRWSTLGGSKVPSVDLDQRSLLGDGQDLPLGDRASAEPTDGEGEVIDPDPAVSAGVQPRAVPLNEQLAHRGRQFVRFGWAQGVLVVDPIM